MSYMDLMGTGFFSTPPPFGLVQPTPNVGSASASNMSNLAKSCCRCTIRVPPVPFGGMTWRPWTCRMGSQDLVSVVNWPMVIASPLKIGLVKL